MPNKALILLLFIILTAKSAQAQLSTNPWVTANDAQEIEKIYQKNRLKNNNSISNYTPESTTVVDRSSAYIEIEEEETSDHEQGFLEKVTLPFAKKEKKLISNTSANRKALAQQRAQAQQLAETPQESNGFDFSLPNFSNPMKKLKMPNLNATSLIQKFERASGINLKAIGKQFK